MRSHGSLISEIREEPSDDVTESPMLYRDTDEQGYPLDYSVVSSGAYNSHSEGKEGHKSVVVVGGSNLSGIPDHEPGESHRSQEHRIADREQPPTGWDYSLAGTPNENFPEVDTAYWRPFMYNIPDNGSHLNSPTSHLYPYINPFHTREQQLAYCELSPKSCVYTLAETPYEKCLKTNTSHSPFMNKIHRNTPHMNYHCGQTPCLCGACGHTSSFFADSKSRKTTYSGENLDDEHWGCAVCNFKCSNEWTLANHVKTHSQETPFSCTVCDYYFANASALESHLKGHHYDGSKMHDNTPSRSHTSMKSSSRTNDTFSEYLTSIQDEAYSSDNLFSNSYYSQKHPGAYYEPTHESCDCISGGTPNGRCLETDTGYRPFAHNTLQASMKSSERTNDACSAHLKGYQKIDTEGKSFSCVLCVFTTNNKQNLWNHVDLHIRKTPFQCKICNYYFANALVLESHFWIHHCDGNQERNSAVPNLSTQDEAKSVDNTSSHPQQQISANCLKPPKGRDNTTFGSSALNEYLKTDSGCMPFKPEVKKKWIHSLDACPNFSTNYALLQKHQVTHSGEKQFSCQICFFSTSSKWYLKNHVNVHYKKTQFFCEVCKYYFKSALTLNIHWKGHHEGQQCILPNPSISDEPISKNNRDYLSGNLHHPYMHPTAAGCDHTLAGISNLECFPKTDARKRPFKHDNVSTCASPARFRRRTYAGVETGPFDVHDYTFPYNFSNCAAYPQYLNRHEMVLAGEKTFPCLACDFLTYDKWNLENHERTHLLRTSFFCIVCCFYFASSSDLESHLRIHRCDAHISLPSPSKPVEEEQYSSGSRDCTSSSSLHPQVSSVADCEGTQGNYTHAETSEVNMLSKGDTEVRTLMHNNHEATPDSTTTHTEKRRLLYEENGHIYDHTSDSKSQFRSFTEELSSSDFIQMISSDDSDLETQYRDVAADASALRTPDHAGEAHASDLKAPDHDGEAYASDLKTSDHAGEADASALQAGAKAHTEESTLEPGDFTLDDTSASESHTMTYDEPETFLCEFCAHTFVDASDFESHMRNHTDDQPDSAQEACDDESRNLQSSVEGQTTTKKYACGICNYESPHSSYVKVHRRIHTGEKPYHCTVCEYSSAFHSGLKQHMISHSGQKPFACGVCDFKTAYPAVLKKHEKAHICEKSYECTMCDYSSAFQSGLNQHMITHSGVKPFACGVCDFKTAYPAVLKKHEKAHTGEKLSFGSECDFKCDRKTDLRAHSKNHSDEEQITPTCYVCGHESTDLSSLKDHMETHTKGPLSGNACDSKSANTENHVKFPTKEMFTCEMCAYTSTTAVKLERHKNRMKHNIVGSDKFAEKRRMMYSGCKY